jgi:transmembrane sensor
MKAEARAVTNRQILDEASAWFVDFRVGDVDTDSRVRFDEWLRASPEHIRAYMEIAKTYVELPALKSDQNLDLEARIAAARSDARVLELRQALPAGPDSQHRRPVVRRWAVAASLALLLMASAVAAWLWQHRYPTYTTEIGEVRSITLADGSTVDLNARSEIRIEFSKDKRAVELIEGQALFEVAKDASRPFVVKSGSALVLAVGTQFDVNRAKSGTTVTVIEGRVAVSDESAVGSKAALPAPPVTGSGDATPHSGPVSSAATYVSAGEEVTITRAQVSQPRRADVAAITAWTQHRLIFDGTRLDDVVEQFNRYNTRQLVIEAAELEDFHVSGVYASTDPASLIRFLKEQPGISVVESDQVVRITRP